MTIHLTQVEYLNDIHVLQLNSYPCFIDKHSDEFFIGSHVVENALDHKNLFKACHTKGSGAIDLGHAARRDLLKQLIFAEMLGAHKPFRPDCNHP